MKNLFQSLDKYIAKDNISDYYCENCKNKVEITKNSCLCYLPNILIINLSRLIFNLEILINEKINSKLEFPMELNLFPYTKEGLLQNQQSTENSMKGLIENKQIHPKEYYLYKLIGVVVHIGTAEGGHYISYINTHDNEWLEFNDSLIRSFDPKSIEKECFGGND